MRKYVLMCLFVLVCLILLIIPRAFARTSPAATAGDTTAPVIWIVSPTDGSSVSGTKVRVNFYAFDAGGFDRYELYVDGVLKQTLLPTAKNPYFTWNPGRNGGDSD